MVVLRGRGAKFAPLAIMLISSELVRGVRRDHLHGSAVASAVGEDSKGKMHCRVTLAGQVLTNVARYGCRCSGVAPALCTAQSRVGEGGGFCDSSGTCMNFVSVSRLSYGHDL